MMHATTAQADRHPGFVYVIHARRRLHHAHHYVGFTRNLPQRLTQHLTGQGAHLTNAFNYYGIRYDVVHVMPGGYDLEAYVKSWHHARQFCPVCRARAGFDTVKCAAGQGAHTYCPIETVRVPAQVRALTQGPGAIVPRWRPFVSWSWTSSGDGYDGCWQDVTLSVAGVDVILDTLPC